MDGTAPARPEGVARAAQPHALARDENRRGCGRVGTAPERDGPDARRGTALVLPARRASRRDRRTEAENTDDAEAANAHRHEDPVLEECPHGTVQGVPDTDTVVDEDGDEANDFLYADPPPPSFAGFVDLTLEDRVANDDDDDDDETSSAGVIRASPMMRCAGCRTHFPSFRWARLDTGR